MKTKRARPQVTSNPGTMLFHDRAALATLRNFPDRRNGITLALEELTDAEWAQELPEDPNSDRRRYVPIINAVWHPFELEPVQIEIANTDPEGFIGILCALLKGWWPSEEEHEAIRVAHTVLQQLTGKGWTHNHVQGPEVGVVFSAPSDDGRVMFLSKTQIDEGVSDTQYIVNLVDKKLQGEFPAVFDHGLIPEPEPETNEPPMAATWEQPLAAGLELAHVHRLEAEHRRDVAKLREQVDIAKADTLFTKDEGEAILRTAGARMERNGLVLARVNQHGRTAIEQELSEHVAQDRMPAGLVVDDDNGLINWEGVNYIKQTLLQEYQQAAGQVGHKQASELTELRTENSQKDARITELERVLHASDVQIERLKTEYAKLLQARETIDPTAEFTYERDRAEAVELVESMLAGAGFTMLRDGADGSGAMWMQKLESRAGVQVFLQVPEQVLASGPATVFAYVKQNVGVSL